MSRLGGISVNWVKHRYMLCGFMSGCPGNVNQKAGRFSFCSPLSTLAFINYQVRARESSRPDFIVHVFFHTHRVHQILTRNHALATEENAVARNYFSIFYPTRTKVSKYKNIAPLLGLGTLHIDGYEFRNGFLGRNFCRNP